MKYNIRASEISSKMLIRFKMVCTFIQPWLHAIKFPNHIFHKKVQKLDKKPLDKATQSFVLCQSTIPQHPEHKIDQRNKWKSTSNLILRKQFRSVSVSISGLTSALSQSTIRIVFSLAGTKGELKLTSLVSHTSAPSVYITSSFWLPFPGAKRIFFTHPRCVGIPLKIKKKNTSKQTDFSQMTAFQSINKLKKIEVSPSFVIFIWNKMCKCKPWHVTTSNLKNIHILHHN